MEQRNPMEYNNQHILLLKIEILFRQKLNLNLKILIDFITLPNQIIECILDTTLVVLDQEIVSHHDCITNLNEDKEPFNIGITRWLPSHVKVIRMPTTNEPQTSFTIRSRSQQSMERIVRASSAGSTKEELIKVQPPTIQVVNEFLFLFLIKLQMKMKFTPLKQLKQVKSLQPNLLMKINYLLDPKRLSPQPFRELKREMNNKMEECFTRHDKILKKENIVRIIKTTFRPK